jgi:hypothetical protein
MGYGGYPPPPPRSTTPRTLGTLSMVFGGIVSFLSLINLALGKQVGSFTQVNESQREAFDHYLAEVHGASMGLAAMMLVMSIALFVIGTGQRGYKKWAVSASVIWGVLALVCLGIQLFVQLTVMMPALDRFVEMISHGNMPVPIGTIMKVAMVFGLVFYAPYPIIMIVSFRKPDVLASMGGTPVENPAANVF